MQRFAEGLNARGLLLGVNSLTSEAKGVRVQVREGRRDLLDGPLPRPRK